MSKDFSHVGDVLAEIEAKVAFVTAAAQAISEVDQSLLPDCAAWEGLFLITLDILVLTAQARKLAA